MAATPRSARAVGVRTITRAPAPLLVVASAFSVQSGAAVAAGLFDRVGPLPVAWLRSLFAALLLLALDPSSVRRLRGGPIRWVLALGVTFAAMNSCVYEAIDHAPLGIVVTVEFLGPLALAVAGSRRPVDFLWIVLAAGGVALLGSPSAHVSTIGLLFSLLAAVCWATYILVAKRMLASWPFTTGLCLSLAVGGLVLAPVGAVKAGSELGAPGVLAVALCVALLSSVVPYVLELAALRRLRTSTFGIMMSLEPAVAAIVGAAVLAQSPGALGALAIVLVTIASIGANRERRVPLPPEA